MIRPLSAALVALLALAGPAAASFRAPSLPAAPLVHLDPPAEPDRPPAELLNDFLPHPGFTG